MGFWGSIGKGLLGAVGLGAAPFTGGASLATILPGAIGSVAGGLAKGAEKGRESQNTAANDAAKFSLQERAGHEQALENRAGIDLRRKADSREAQGDAYSKAMRGAYGMHVQDVHANRPAGVPTIAFSGGMRPSAYGQEGRDASKTLNEQAMKALMDGEHFDALPEMERTQPAAYKGPGFWENVLGGVGTAGTTIKGLQTDAMNSTNNQNILAAIGRIGQSGGRNPLGSLADEENR